MPTKIPRSELEEFWTELHNIMNHLAGTDHPDDFVSIMEATQEGLVEREEFDAAELENEKLKKEIDTLTRCGIQIRKATTAAVNEWYAEYEELKDFALKIHNFTYKDEEGNVSPDEPAMDLDAILKRLNHDEKAITYDFEAIYEEMYEGRTENEKLKKEIEESKKVDTDDV